ncbi:MAG: flippase-like domain-containing protein [Anaerolineales bacterium]|nr:flippase-like domain-containing protein [Anaerolineales bacterium]
MNSIIAQISYLIKRLRAFTLWLVKGATPAAQRTRLLLKILFFVILFSLLFWIVPIEKVLRALLEADPKYLLLGLFLGFLVTYLRTIQLAILAWKQGIKLSINKLLAINLSIKFYMLFTPGEFVGSGLRWYKLAQPEGKHVEALATVAINRLIDLYFVIFSGLGFLLLSGHERLGSGWQGLALLVGVTILVWFALTWISEPLLAWIQRSTFRRWLRWESLAHYVERLLLAFAAYTRFSVWELFLVALFSVGRHLVGVASFLYLAKSVGIDLAYMQMGWIRMLILLASLLPIAFADGLGVREVSLLALLSTFGIDGGLSLAFSFLLFVEGIILSLIGGLLEFFQVVNTKQSLKQAAELNRIQNHIEEQ